MSAPARGMTYQCAGRGMRCVEVAARQKATREAARATIHAASATKREVVQ